MPRQQQTYNSLIDMIDGGGPGRSGNTFQGGGIISEIANALAAPYGSQLPRRNALGSPSPGAGRNALQDYAAPSFMLGDILGMPPQESAPPAPEYGPPPSRPAPAPQTFISPNIPEQVAARARMTAPQQPTQMQPPPRQPVRVPSPMPMPIDAQATPQRAPNLPSGPSGPAPGTVRIPPPSGSGGGLTPAQREAIGRAAIAAEQERRRRALQEAQSLDARARSAAGGQGGQTVRIPPPGQGSPSAGRTARPAQPVTQYADDAKAQRGFGRSAYRSGLDDAPSIPARGGVTTPAQGRLDSTPGGYGNIQTPQEARAWEASDAARRRQLGATAAAALNSAGEMMTGGLVGDEAAGRFDQMIGRGDADERTEFYRRQQDYLRATNPGVAVAADIGGAMLGPGLGARAVINGARTVGGAVLRGAGVGAASGATMGAMEGENPQERVSGGLAGGAVGALAGGAITAAGAGFQSAARALSRRPELREVIPTLDGLREESQALYRAAERSGATLPQQAVSGLAARTERTLRSEGYHPRLHPRIGVILDELGDMRDRAGASLREMDLLRRIAGSAGNSLDRDERRLAGMAIDAIDDTVDSLGEASAPLRQARAIWARMRRLERVEGIIADASNADNFERTLQSRFRTFLRNPKNLRGYSEREVQLMRLIANGGPAVRALRGLGQLLSPNSLPGVAIAGGATYSAGLPGLAAPVAGMGVGAVANAMIRGRAGTLRDAVAMPDNRRRIVEQLLRQNNPAAPAAGAAPAGLMAYPPPYGD